MKTKKLIGFALALAFLSATHYGMVNAQQSSVWKVISNNVRPLIDTWDVYAPANLEFYGEIQPDGATCSDGEILKKTGANDWDCAADNGGAGGGVATSSAGTYAEGNLVYAINSSTISASSGFKITSSSGVVALTGGLSLTGNATATGNIQAATLKATGAVNLSSTLIVSGATTLQSTLNAQTSTLSAIVVGGDTVDELAGAYLTVDGNNDLNVDSELASSSASFVFYDATSTAPYKFQKWRNNKARTIAAVSCDEYAAATTTVQLYRSTLGTTTNSQTILASIACGINGTSTTSFTSSTLPADSILIANSTSVAGTPTLTTVNVYFTTND